MNRKAKPKKMPRAFLSTLLEVRCSALRSELYFFLSMYRSTDLSEILSMALVNLIYRWLQNIRFPSHKPYWPLIGNKDRPIRQLWSSHFPF